MKYRGWPLSRNRRLKILWRHDWPRTWIVLDLRLRLGLRYDVILGQRWLLLLRLLLRPQAVQGKHPFNLLCETSSVAGAWRKEINPLTESLRHFEDFYASARLGGWE